MLSRRDTIIKEKELRYQLMKLRFDLRNGKLFNSSSIKHYRKLIAQLLTLRKQLYENN